MALLINLHIHTTYSDGGNTPAEIVAMLKDAGVTTFSITDHDTVEGNVEAAALAKEYRRESSVCRSCEYRRTPRVRPCSPRAAPPEPIRRPGHR